MKNTTKCPKCASNEIIRILPNDQKTGNHIHGGWFNLVGVVRYVCAKCGFSEEWIGKPKDIAILKKTYGVQKEE